MRLKQFCLVVGLVAFLLLIPLPVGQLSRHWHALTSTIENTGHPLVFWWLTAHLLPVVRARVSAAPRAYAVTLVLAVAFGLATEYIQSLVGRDASWEDARNDTFGAIFALALQARRDLRDAGRSGWRPLAAVIALVMGGVALFPMAWTSTAYVLRWQAFPVIWSPDALFARRFSRWKQDAYPGLVIDEPARDWSGYTALQIQVRSLRNTGNGIRIRVHDQQHNQELRDRYERTFVLPDNRERTLTIPLDVIRHGPAVRDLDLSAVRGLSVCQGEPREPPRFAVGEIRLVR